jgi:uncharacterized membrane protein HdeD (DUF308 family)
MNISKKIGVVLGPTIMAMTAAEFPMVQPHLYDAQIPPVVYLSGVLMFVAGLAIVYAHNLWTRDWRLLITLTGWFFLLLGLFRMFAAAAYQRNAGAADSTVWIVLEAALILVGLIITFKAYTTKAQEDLPPQPH